MSHTDLEQLFSKHAQALQRWHVLAASDPKDPLHAKYRKRAAMLLPKHGDMQSVEESMLKQVCASRTGHLHSLDSKRAGAPPLSTT